MQSDDDMPSWDIAISGMVEEAFRKAGKPLSLEDFRALAREYDFWRSGNILASNGNLHELLQAITRTGYEVSLKQIRP